MKVIKDKILENDKTYEDCKFVRCLNVGAILKNCVWESGNWKRGLIYGDFYWKGGIWYGNIRSKIGIWKNYK